MMTIGSVRKAFSQLQIPLGIFLVALGFLLLLGAGAVPSLVVAFFLSGVHIIHRQKGQV